MRKVKFKKYIKPVYLDNDGNLSEKPTVRKEPGTGCYEPDFNTPGYFHSWAQMQDGQEAEMVALVEVADGTIVDVSSNNIKFDEPYNNLETMGKIGSRYELITDQQYLLQCTQSIALFNNYNFERWPAFNTVKHLELQDEIGKACFTFTVEPIIVSNNQILFMQKGGSNVLEFDGKSGRWSLYGSCVDISANLAVRHIFEDYFDLL